MVDACIPPGPVQNLMIAAEPGLIAQPHDAQRLSDRAFAGRQHGAGHQHENVAPHRGGEARSEHRQPHGQNGWNQGWSRRRDGARAIRLHRSLGIDRHARRKSLLGTTPSSRQIILPA